MTLGKADPEQKSAQGKELIARKARARMMAGVKTDPVENLPQGKTRDKLAAGLLSFEDRQGILLKPGELQDRKRRNI